MISIEEINTFDQALGLKEEWDKLVDEVGLDVSMSFDFVMSLWEAWFDKRDIILLLVKDEGRLIGIFPLYITKQKMLGIFAVNKIGILTNIFSFHNDFIIKDKESKIFNMAMDYLHTNYGMWDVFEITDVSAESQANEWLNKSKDKSFLKYKGTGAPYAILNNGLESYVQNRPQKFRQNLRRAEKELEKSGKPEVRYFGNPDEVDYIFDRIREIESESWKERDGTTLEHNEKQKTFFKSYFRKAADRDKLLAIFLCINGEYAAFSINAIDKKVCYPMLMSYKRKFKKYSPGSIIWERLIKRLFELKFEKFDMFRDIMLNKEQALFKRKWAIGELEDFSIWLYNDRINDQFLYHLNKMRAFVNRFMNSMRISERLT